MRKDATTSKKNHKPVLIRGGTYAKCSKCGDLAGYNSSVHDYGVINPNGCGAVFTATIDIPGGASRKDLVGDI